jgi:hypothetical protein
VFPAIARQLPIRDLGRIRPKSNGRLHLLDFLCWGDAGFQGDDEGQVEVVLVPMAMGPFSQENLPSTACGTGSVSDSSDKTAKADTRTTQAHAQTPSQVKGTVFELV